MLQKAIKLLNGNLVNGWGGRTPCELLTMAAPEAPQTIKTNATAVATAVGCTPELDGKTLSLKTANARFGRVWED